MLNMQTGSGEAAWLTPRVLMHGISEQFEGEDELFNHSNKDANRI